MEIKLQSKRTDFVVNIATDPRDLLWHFSGPVEPSRRIVLFEISVVRADVYNAVQLIFGPLFAVFSWLRRPTSACTPTGTHDATDNQPSDTRASG